MVYPFDVIEESNQFQLLFYEGTILKNHQFDFINGPLIK